MKRTIAAAAACLLLAGCGQEIGVNSDPAPAASASSTVTTQSTAVQTTASQTTASETTAAQISASDSSIAEEAGLLSSPDDIGLHDTDGGGMNYAFTYNGEVFSAIYTPDNWKIFNSYKITDLADIELICEALISVWPIHGADMESWRTADDLAFEWQEHNAAYMLLPDSSKWKTNVKDVDLNPKDQGKTGVEMALDRINKKTS